MFEIDIPTKIIFNDKGLTRLKKEAKVLGNKAFIVCGKSLFSANIVEQIKEKLNLPCFVFNEIYPEVDMSEAEKGALKAKEENCDFVIGVGGGTVMDAAKGISLLMTNEGKLKDFLDISLIKNPTAPLMVIPTIAGTGSEVTKYAVSSDRSKKSKFTIKNIAITPNVAIIDSDITSTVPLRRTIAGSVDSLVHCLEGIISKGSIPIITILAIDGINTIIKFLPKLKDNPSDLALREKMSYASLISGIVITNVRTGMIHTMSAAIEPRCDKYHGEIVGSLLPQMLKFYKKKGVSFEHLDKIFKGDFTKIIEEFIEEFDLGITYNIPKSEVLSMVDRVLMDKGLLEIAPVDVKPEELEKLFKRMI